MHMRLRLLQKTSDSLQASPAGQPPGVELRHDRDRHRRAPDSLARIRRDLERMEARVENYLDRLSFQEGDRERLESAQAALAEAHSELARICEEASRR